MIMKIYLNGKENEIDDKAAVIFYKGEIIVINNEDIAYTMIEEIKDVLNIDR